LPFVGRTSKIERMADKVQIGIIGAGGITTGAHLPAFKELSGRCDVVAICDVQKETAQKVAAEAGIESVFSSHQEMLEKAKLDAVIVATPNRFHREPAIDALRAGKHVLCEKPLGIDGEDARQMCAAARDAGKLLQVGLQGRFFAPSQYLKEFIDEGGLGPIYYARAWALRRRKVPAWGVFIDKEKQGGGPLIDIGVHVLDLTMWLMGNPKPVSASGKTWNHLGTNPELMNEWGSYDRSKFTVEDFAVGLIRFENGAVVTLESSFMANIEGDPYQTQLMGEKAGALLKPAMQQDALTIFSEDQGRIFDVKPAYIPPVKGAHIAAATAFLDSIMEGKPSQVPGEQGMTLNAIFDALYKSSETGKEEEVVTAF
jgi:predicted dehydrogenase